MTRVFRSSRAPEWAYSGVARTSRHAARKPLLSRNGEGMTTAIWMLSPREASRPCPAVPLARRASVRTGGRRGSALAEHDPELVQRVTLAPEPGHRLARGHFEPHAGKRGDTQPLRATRDAVEDEPSG